MGESEMTCQNPFFHIVFTFRSVPDCPECKIWDAYAHITQKEVEAEGLELKARWIVCKCGGMRGEKPFSSRLKLCWSHWAEAHDKED